MLTHRPTLRSSRWIPLVLVAALAALALNLVTPSSIHAGPTGNLTVSKVIDNGQPGADPGIFDLFVSGVLQANNVFDFDNLPGVIDGSTPSVIVAPGVISFHEVAEFGTSLASYTISAACTGALAGQPLNVGVGSWTIPIAAGENVFCTITNTRIAGTLTLHKVIDDGQPGADPGIFNLLIANTLQAINVTDLNDAIGVSDGLTAAVAVAPGAVLFHETPVGATNLSSYAITATCVGAIAGQPLSTGVGSWSIAIGAGENVACTITNSRNSGTLTLHKIIDDGQPGADDGVFDLYINSIRQADNVTDSDNAATVVDGMTPPTVIQPAGTATFHELGDSGTDLAAYIISVICTGTTALPTNTGVGAWTIAVTTGQNIVCTITNTRNTGTLKVEKIIDNDRSGPDNGVFDLYVAGNVQADNVTDGQENTTLADGMTPVLVLQAGVITFHELGDNGTNLGSYNIGATCTGAAAGQPTTTGLGAWTIAISAGENVVCTITNTLDSGSLKLIKIIDDGRAGPDDGVFDLFIDGRREADDVTDDESNSASDDGMTGVVLVEPGTIPFHETGDDGTDLDLYAIEVRCTGASADPVSTGTGAWEIAIEAGEDVVCTIHNTRHFFQLNTGGGFYAWDLCDGNASDFFLDATIAWLWVSTPRVAPFGHWLPFIPELWLVLPDRTNDFSLDADEDNFLWIVAPRALDVQVCPPPFV